MTLYDSEVKATFFYKPGMVTLYPFFVNNTNSTSWALNSLSFNTITVRSVRVPGVLHNTDGPAVVYDGSPPRWYLDGMEVQEQEWEITRTSLHRTIYAT